MKRFYRLCQILACIGLTICALTISAAAADLTTPPNPNSTTSSPQAPQSPTTTPLGQAFAQLMFGQEVHARDGATYFESADQAGSGRQGTSNNIYTEQLYIAGFAQVDTSGDLVDWLCYDRDNVPVGSLAPSFTVDCHHSSELYIATYTNGFTTGSVGWFNADDLDWQLGSLEYADPRKDPMSDPGLPIGSGYNDSSIHYYDPESPTAFDSSDVNAPKLSDLGEQITPAEVVQAIETTSTQGEKIALVLDASGSVSKYSAAIASYADQVDNAECIITFAGNALAIEAGEYFEASYSLYGGTDIYSALNLIPEESFDRVLLVTDTEHNDLWSNLNPRTDIGAVTILNPTNIDEQFVLQTIEDEWGITPSISRLHSDGTTD